MAALTRMYAGGTRQRKITPRATKPWPDADTHRLCAHGAVEHRSLQPASNRAKRACAASCSPPRMQWRVGALQGRKGDKRPAPRAEAARTTRAPEQVECAGFESPLKNWGAPRRHVDSGSPGGRQNDLSVFGSSAPAARSQHQAEVISRPAGGSRPVGRGRKKKSFWLGVSARVRSRPRLPASAGRQSRDKTIRNTRNRISMSVDPFSTDSGSDGALGFTPLRARSATPSYAGSGGAPRTVPQSLVFSHSRASSECMGATLAGLVVMFVWA